MTASSSDPALHSSALQAVERQFAELCASPPEHAAWKAFAAALAAVVSDEAERLRWMEAALAAHPRNEAVPLAFADAWARAGMGERVRPRAVPELGIGILRRALAVTEPGEHRRTIHSNLCFLHNELGEHVEAERHGRLAAGCQNQIYHLWLAEALFFQKKFARDPQCAVDFSTFETAALQRLADEVSATVQQRPLGSGDDFVVLVSVDAVYFRRFAIALLLSAQQSGSRLAFHFHVLNPDDGTRAMIDAIRARVPDLRVDFTAETWPARGPNSDRVYYASSRLLIARQIMERTGAGVVIADADVLFRRAPDAMLRQETAGFDLATVHYWGEPMCNRYNASFFVIRRTPLSLLFLRMVEEFLAQNFRSCFLWMIDQVALFCCEYRLAAVTQGAIKTRHWPESVVSIHQLPDSPIWSGATTAKWTDTPYDRYRRELLARAGFDPEEPGPAGR